ncbi:hypothetical protein [Plantactinospora sp. GCM10030261]|uniref:hypothetical protein n=1 Tax=Plantactinospora sp. GCM10030261 TaxID=3273420 RepID=UPI0036079FA4
MTKKIAISIPDDVAERLEREPNVSAFITRAVRRQMAGEHTRQTLRQVGFRLSDADLAAAGRQLDEAQAKLTPELRAKAAALLSEASSGRLAIRE